MFIPLKKAVKGFGTGTKIRYINGFLTVKDIALLSARPLIFLLGEIQKRLGFDELICTRHNAKTGAIIGKNCRDEEKVNRLLNFIIRMILKLLMSIPIQLSTISRFFHLEKLLSYSKGKKVPFEFKNIYG